MGRTVPFGISRIHLKFFSSVSKLISSKCCTSPSRDVNSIPLGADSGYIVCSLDNRVLSRLARSLWRGETRISQIFYHCLILSSLFWQGKQNRLTGTFSQNVCTTYPPPQPGNRAACREEKA
jgi:hypothetical protein